MDSLGDIDILILRKLPDSYESSQRELGPNKSLSYNTDTITRFLLVWGIFIIFKKTVS